MNSTANDPQKLSRKELSESIDLKGLEKRLDIRQQEEDVEGIRRMGRLAVKYMGKQNGFQVQKNRIKIVSSFSGGGILGGCKINHAKCYFSESYGQNLSEGALNF